MRFPLSRPFLAFMLLAVSAALPAAVIAQDASPEPSNGPITVIASGLTNPRGITWGDNGELIIAQAGTGGETVLPVGEGFTFDIGLTASVATVADGCATPLIGGLISLHWQEAGWIWGAMDVVNLNGAIYLLMSSSGPYSGSPAYPSGIYRIDPDGTVAIVADIGAWLRANPPAFTPPDYGADGSLFDLEADGDSLLLSEAVGGRVIRVGVDGAISQVADLSDGHMVPTGLAIADDGVIFVGYETTPPYDDGTSKISMIGVDGTVADAYTGLTAVTDIAFGPDGALYVAEMSTGNTDEAPYFTENSGRVVRVSADGIEPVVTELPPPVHLSFDAIGQLLVVLPAFGPERGIGQGAIISVDPAAGPVSAADMEMPATCAA